MSEIERIVIVGGGQAGASAAAQLRALEFNGAITLVGEEPTLPYQRPPLSKKYLLGQLDLERLLIKPKAFYDSNDIELRLGVEVAALEREERSLNLSDGTRIAWDRLLLATGTKARSLPPQFGNGFDNIRTIRTLADVDALAPVMATAKRVLVVGGGYIGLELASAARQLGLDTTVVEAADRILQRVAAEATSTRVAELHRSHNVEIREGVTLEKLEAQGDDSCRATLGDGTELAADLVVVGIGVVPVTGLAEAAGLEISNGIAVDQFCRTSDDRIFAAGDCASFPWRGRRIRLESVQNAIEQAEAAAANMIGHQTSYEPVPWFWSDQFDAKLQIAGLNQGYDRTVERAGAREGASSAWYFRGDELLAVDAFNDAAAYMTGKRLLEAGHSPSIADVADNEIPLKQLLSARRPS